MPQYAAIIYSKDVDWTLPEYATDMKEYNEFGQAAAAVMRGGAALYQTSTATTVRVRNGKVSTTDGPFAETKEQLGGYYMLEARDLNEAIQIAARIPGARTGCVEVRPVADDARTLRALGMEVRQ